MLQYITRRLLQFIPVFFGVTLVLFFITTILPGDPIKMRAGEKSMSPAVYEQLRIEYGFDQPWYVQYVNYLKNLAQGDLGTSITTGRPVERHHRRQLSLHRQARLRGDHHRDHRRCWCGDCGGGQALQHLGRLDDAGHVDTGRVAGVLARHHAPVHLRHLAQERDERPVLPSGLGRLRAAASLTGST